MTESKLVRPSDLAWPLVDAPWRQLREGQKVRFAMAMPAYRGGLYDSILPGSVRFSPDLKHVAYLAKDGAETFVVMAHQQQSAPGQAQSDMSQGSYVVSLVPAPWLENRHRLPQVPQDLMFSRDLRHAACRIAADDGKTILYLDGTPIDSLGHAPRLHLTLSPDGQRLAYSISDDKGQGRVCVNGKTVASYQRATITDVTFSPDGKRLAYVLDQGKQCAVVDGRRGPQFDKIKRNYPGWEQVFFFSRDGRRVAYVGRRSGKDVLAVDQSPREPLDRAEILGITFSPDGGHVACMAGRADEKWFVIVDGLATTPRGLVIFKSITFSPDGRYLAYLTSVEGGWTAVVNDVAGATYRGIAYKEAPVVFHAPDRFHYVVETDGAGYVIEECLSGAP